MTAENKSPEGLALHPLAARAPPSPRKHAEGWGRRTAARGPERHPPRRLGRPLLPAPARPYVRLARLDRPIGTWLLLFPGWWGIALAARRWPDPALMALFGSARW